jgi:hypothetical protein
MGETTEMPESARLLRYLPPWRLAVVVFVDVPEGIFTPIRAITDHVTDITHATGDDAAADIATVVFASFVDTTTPRQDKVGAGFHRLPPLKQ